MKKTLLKNLNIALTIVFIAFATTGNANAFGITGVHNNDAVFQAAEAPGDIRQGVGQESEHSIEFTLDADTNIDAGETITLTWLSGQAAGEFFDFNGIAAADVDVFVNGVAQTLTTDYTVAITTLPAAGVDGVITITAVTAFAVATNEVSIVIGDDSTRIINPAQTSAEAAADDAADIALGESSFYKVTINGTFGTEGGTPHSIKSALVYPILSDDQVHVYAYIAPTLSFNLDSGDTSYNNGNDTSNAASCAVGAADDDDQTCDFFTDYGNSIDFGMPLSTATQWATPTHPTEVMNGGDNIATTATILSDNVATDGGAHGFNVGTNAANGLVTTVWGETLTKGAATIAALTAAAAPAIGTDQFGFCLSVDDAGVDGTDATVTPAPAGAVSAALGADAVNCSTGTYRFQATASGAGTPTLNTIAISAGPTSTTFFDMEYMMNIAASTPAGLYQTDLTFITTGLF